MLTGQGVAVAMPGSPAQYTKLKAIDLDELDQLDGALAAVVSRGGAGWWERVGVAMITPRLQVFKSLRCAVASHKRRTFAW